MKFKIPFQQIHVQNQLLLTIEMSEKESNFNSNSRTLIVQIPFQKGEYVM